PVDVLVAGPGQPDLHVVFAVLREGVRDQDAAARPQRQPLDVAFLGLIRRGPKGVAVGGQRLTPEGQPAGFLRRRDVTFQERRREAAQGGAVEAVVGLVGRQQRRGVHVQRQEVTDGVLVLG